jgi:hypothetical protein
VDRRNSLNTNIPKFQYHKEWYIGSGSNQLVRSKFEHLFPGLHSTISSWKLEIGHHGYNSYEKLGNHTKWGLLCFLL